MTNYTKNGLILILIGMIIGIISNVLFYMFQYLMSNEDISSFFGLIGFGIIGGIGGIIVFIGAILFLIGRKEFNEKHQRFVIYAVILVVMNIIVITVLAVIGIFINIAAGGTDFSSSIVLPTLTGAILGGLVYIFALYELEDEKGRYLLYISYIVSIIIAVVIVFYTMGELSDYLNEVISTENQPTNFSSTMAFTSRLSNISVLSVISNILWAIAVYIPYKRIKDGDLVPQSKKVYDEASSVIDRICPNCIRVIPNDANICPYCGKRF